LSHAHVIDHISTDIVYPGGCLYDSLMRIDTPSAQEIKTPMVMIASWAKQTTAPGAYL
jgi:hypothetical protein